MTAPATTAARKEQFRQFVSALFEPTDPIEFRLLRFNDRCRACRDRKPCADALKEMKCRKTTDEKPVWCKAKDASRHFDKLLRMNGPTMRWNVYVGINPRATPKGKRDAEVNTFRVLYQDFDGETLEAITERLAMAEVAPPTIVIDSGNGFHSHWKLDAPYVRETTDDDKIERIIGGMAKALTSDPKVKNASRIMRVPGFVNYKLNREPREARIIHIDETATVTLDEFSRFAKWMDKKPASPTPVATTPIVTPDDAVRRCAAYVRAMPGAVEGDHGDDETFRAASVCVRDFALTDADAMDVLRTEFNPRCVPPWGDAELAAKVENARKYAKHAPGEKLAVSTINAKDTHGGNGTNSTASSKTTADKPAKIITLTKMADVSPVAVEWLWAERFAIGKLTMMSGDGGLGKSFLTLDMAARVSRGTPWPDGSPNEVGGVLLISCEDDVGDTMRPRLDAAGADPSNVYHLDDLDLTNIPAVRSAIQQTPDCRLVIIDPISAYLGKTDAHSNGEVRAFLKPLAMLAADLRVAIVAVNHIRKGDGSAAHRTIGSVAFTNAARAAYVVCKDRDDSTGMRRFLLPVKNNIGNDRDGFAYRLMSAAGEQAFVAWETAPVTITADEAMAPAKESGKPTECDAWLRDALAGRSRPAAEVEAEARGAGFTTTALRTARKRLGMLTERVGFGAGGGWCWRLPTTDAPIDAHSPPHKTSASMTSMTPMDPSPSPIDAIGVIDAPVFCPGKRASMGAPMDPDDLRERFDERAGTLEFEAGMSREDAERQASSELGWGPCAGNENDEVTR